MLVATNVPNLPFRTLKQDQCDARPRPIGRLGNLTTNRPMSLSLLYFSKFILTAKSDNRPPNIELIYDRTVANL